VAWSSIVPEWSITDTRGQCARVDCASEAVARGLCNPHYRALWRKAGGALQQIEPPTPKRRVGRRSIFVNPADQDMSWQDHGNCLGLDPDLFFPERGASTREAKEVCRGCVVRETCLEYALATGEKHGIWGGMSDRERRRIRKQRQESSA
jgi:WhiB family transcriptional regulator, redox-sensing transcriptional regulator